MNSFEQSQTRLTKRKLTYFPVVFPPSKGVQVGLGLGKC